jgi:tRNA pseudouridine38-40 synthase
MIKTVRMNIEYDGTRFHGWQVQPNQRTVQGVIEDALAQLLRREVRIHCAGRTDAGVHARGQVASFVTESDFPINSLSRALNGNLPNDIAVHDVFEVPEKFHARYSALSRMYRYTLSERRRALGRNYVWHIKYHLDRHMLMKATEPLIGECNLRGFSKGDDNDDYSTVIVKNEWTFEDDLMIFTIQGIRFFHHAVRSIVGSAVEVARGKEPPGLLEMILAERNRDLAGPTAPAKGLCLERVFYDRDTRVGQA